MSTPSEWACLPPRTTRALEQRLEEMRLLRRHDDGGAVLTRAAMLLFSSDDVIRVEITAREVFLPIAGNALVVLDRVLDALDELNETYRLKGATSRTCAGLTRGRSRNWSSMRWPAATTTWTRLCEFACRPAS